MKRLILLISSLFLLSKAWAQPITFRINDGTSDPVLKERIEANLSRLLTAINLAPHEGPDLTGIQLSEDAGASLRLLWRNMPFRCDEEMVVERLLTTYDGYQVRNVPIEVQVDSRNGRYQELVIDMAPSGRIERINLAIQNHLYRKIISDGTEVSDLRHRQMILDYVEQFRTAYNKKDLDFLEKVFSDDALIITGKVIRRKAGDRTTILKDQHEIVYSQLKKKEYLERLRTRVFPQASYINVRFSDISVSKHPSIDGYYGVMLKQGYESSNYSDEGYLFMVWDFRDEANPQIHVRTWQPYWLDEQKSQKLDESKVFNINNFIIE
jgi:hypothetical protein